MNLALQLEEIEKQVSALISENINLKTENTNLKRENKEQNTSLLTSVENLNKSVQELEKKNVELKADNLEWEKASDKWKNLYDSTNEQLTEAKDIIKKLMYSPRECIYWYALCNKVKRFLKEIEE